ncbi:bifunctional [glutamine synthetase] adenylyltransferase/[glutamine synthetase]-adenylyl-L-tyrosine phosphorylase, partial [Brucella melitensis]
GIIDLEFIAQFATLAGYVKKTPRPFATEEVLANLDPFFGDPAMVDGLVEAHRFYTNLSQAIRLCLNDSAGLDQFPPGMRELLCRVAGLPDIERIEYELLEHYRLVRAAFDKLVGHGAD